MAVFKALPLFKARAAWDEYGSGRRSAAPYPLTQSVLLRSIAQNGPSFHKTFGVLYCPIRSTRGRGLISKYPRMWVQLCEARAK